MKLFFTVVLACYAFVNSQAQIRITNKKYPSLLWEITGKGLNKPSYLIGTMHVSSKLAFNLPDSFYFAIRRSQVVALESNPETWQEDMSKYEFAEPDYSSGNDAYSHYTAVPNEFFNIKTLRFYKYDKKIEKALYSNPSSINNLLYRSYGNETNDFEEDTYLDMYIFQCGKKWSKTVTGVEDYGESMRLMAEAYRDAAKDKNLKRRSYSDADNDYSADKLQEAYRTGNLDLLDSINRYNSVSEAFDEKFLYKRNEIQANSIDSILRSGSSLFVGVGAAHLPGQRGVIEMLRRMGYTLRPVKMGERASREKDLVDNIRVPVVFRTETAKDGLFKVDIPGKFYSFGDDASLDQKQYADMSNGSYYMVTRIMTNAWMWNHSTDDVFRTVDSLLYENIPGKIISKTTITRNGYKGLDITNRTRRGDLQRYNIFITPFEIIVFKMSGNGEYIKTGTEASRFFGSIQFKEYKNGSAETHWKKYSPPYGGFEIDFPHPPYMGNDGSWIFDATDKNSGEHYRVLRTDIHNHHFVEEDSFDLSLMDESFASSDFVTAQQQRTMGKFKGRPSLDGRYTDKLGNVYLVRYLIAGPHYYTIVAHGKKESPAMQNFLNSFNLRPYQYNPPKWQRDSSLYFTVNTPVYPVDAKIKLSIPQYSYYGTDEEEEGSETDQLEGGTFRSKIISNDSTGEKVFVSFYRSPRYFYTKDSSTIGRDIQDQLFGSDSSGIIKINKKSVLPNKMKVWELLITDSNSSRALWGKSYYKDGVGFSIATQIDTSNSPSPFLRSFFDSFSPVDTVKGVNPFVKKSDLFFADFNSGDSSIHQRAVKSIGDIDLDSSDLNSLTGIINTLGWKEKKYLDVKTSLIGKLGDIKTNASADYLNRLYYSLDDTIQLQYSVLENLLQHKTQYAYNLFREIIRNEPPVLDPDLDNPSNDYGFDLNLGYEFDDGKFLDDLSDTLKLTKTILPDLLPLLNLEDYKAHILKLLGQLIDSNLITVKDYEAYLGKFLLEAKQELKKQSIAEKKKAIEKAEELREGKPSLYSYYSDMEKDAGNEELGLYATLLLPYMDKNAAVTNLLQQMLKTSDRRLKYNTLLLLMRNKKYYPDSLLTYFASLDEYRYELYKDLKTEGMIAKFPAKYNNHRDLGISALMQTKSYGKPDSILYLDRLKTVYLDKTGYLYFYKYKEKKDDLNWRLAVVGLVPEQPGEFEFADSSKVDAFILRSPLFAQYKSNKYSFTGFQETRVSDEESLELQLKKMQKRLLYARRKSAKLFYEEEQGREGYHD